MTEKKNRVRKLLEKNYVKSILTAIIASLLTFGTTLYISSRKFENQMALEYNYPDKKFEIRIEEYAKLWEILLPLSSQYPDSLKPINGQELTIRLNNWFYGRGGLIAHEYTRALVFRLRQECDQWKCGERPDKIYDLKDTIIYTTRNDLFLISRVNIKDESKLYCVINKRNEEIKKLRERALLLQVDEACE